MEKKTSRDSEEDAWLFVNLGPQKPNQNLMFAFLRSKIGEEFDYTLRKNKGKKKKLFFAVLKVHHAW